MKAKKAVIKRFKITKTGKIKRRRQMGRHLKAAKSKSQKRRHKQLSDVAKGFRKVIKALSLK